MIASKKSSVVHPLFCVLLTGILIVSLSACADQPDDDLALEDTVIAPGDTSGMLMDDPGGMQADPGAMQGHMAMRGDTADVRLTDYQINMPSTVPAGTIIFIVTNDGSEEHNFEIEGQGEEHVFPQNLQPGETETMEVDLEEGAYEVYCPVGNHRQQGMSLDLTVEGSMDMEMN